MIRLSKYQKEQLHQNRSKIKPESVDILDNKIS